MSLIFLKLSLSSKVIKLKGGFIKRRDIEITGRIVEYTNKSSQLCNYIVEVNDMRKLNTVIVIIFISILLSFTVQAEEQTNNIDKEFDIDLSGYELHSFGSFNQLGYKITPIAQLYFRIIQEEQEWIDEPRLYIKDNKGFVHLWKKDGTNILYKVEKQTSGIKEGLWDVIDVKRKKIDRIPVPKTLLKEVLIEQLIEPISKAIEEHYEPKLWYRGLEKIVESKKMKQTIFIM